MRQSSVTMLCTSAHEKAPLFCVVAGWFVVLDEYMLHTRVINVVRRRKTQKKSKKKKTKKNISKEESGLSDEAATGELRNKRTTSGNLRLVLVQ